MRLAVSNRAEDHLLLHSGNTVRSQPCERHCFPDVVRFLLDLLQDALKAAGQAVGALGDSATAFSSAGGDDKASVAARVAALRRLQAAQKGLQGGI